MLSVHGTKARVMIANFNLDTMKLDLKCSKFQQCDGFERIKGEQEVTEQEDSEQKDSEQEDTVVRARPDDFNSKRDLFFGWLNPICKGDTYLVDAGEGPGMVLPRKAPARSPSTDSSESLS